MSKNRRGTGVRTLPAHGRGTCPRCHTENIKLLYEEEINGQKIKICKYCKAALKNKARVEAKATKPETAAET